jgi:GntR family transcriptional regulator
MLTLTLDLQASVPAYRQIVDQMRHLLVDGRLRPGDRLPGVRRLALDLAIHHNTVAEAYRVLAEEGWLDVSQGRAVRVRQREAARPPVKERAALEQTYRRRLAHLLAEMRAQGVSPRWLSKELRAMLTEVES